MPKSTPAIPASIPPSKNIVNITLSTFTPIRVLPLELYDVALIASPIFVFSIIYTNILKLIAEMTNIRTSSLPIVSAPI